VVALSRLLVFLFLSLSAQTLFAEGIIKQITNLITEDTASQKGGVDSHAASVATEIMANETPAAVAIRLAASISN